MSFFLNDVLHFRVENGVFNFTLHGWLTYMKRKGAEGFQYFVHAFAQVNKNVKRHASNISSSVKELVTAEWVLATRRPVRQHLGVSLKEEALSHVP